MADNDNPEQIPEIELSPEEQRKKERADAIREAVETDFWVKPAPAPEGQPALWFTAHAGCRPLFSSIAPANYCPVCGEERTEEETTYVGKAQLLRGRKDEETNEFIEVGHGLSEEEIQEAMA